MKLKSLNKYISFLILFISFQSLYAEEQIDIWNKEIKEKSQTIKPDNNTPNNTINSEIFKKSQTNTSIKIENEILDENQVYSFDILNKKRILNHTFLPAKNNLRIAITSGASCPDKLVDEVIHKIIKLKNLNSKSLQIKL